METNIKESYVKGHNFFVDKSLIKLSKILSQNYQKYFNKTIKKTLTKTSIVCKM